MQHFETHSVTIFNNLPMSDFRATETHALAAANQQKNDRLREAFGISTDYVDGSSFHPERKEREKEKKEQERLEREKQQKYM